MKLYIISIIAFLLTATSAKAELIINENNNTVVNNISAEANSGGQVYQDGALVESGESSAKSSVYTEVNGQVVQDIEEYSTSTSEAEINIKSKIKVFSDQSEVETIVEKKNGTSSPAEVSEYKKEINLPASQKQTVKAKKLEDKKIIVVPKPIIFIWQSLVKFLKSFFSLFN